MIGNDVNELTGIDLIANGTPNLDLTFDSAGNLREEDRDASTTYRSTHDPWNRLVKIEIDRARTEIVPVLFACLSERLPFVRAHVVL